VNLLYGREHIIIPWICAHLKIRDPGLCAAIGVERNGQIIGGCLYNKFQLDYLGRPNSIEISFVTIDKRWATRGNIAAFLAYPFVQLRVKRVQLTIAKRNKEARQFVTRLGFTLEGIARKAHEDGTDAAVYSMLWHECKWIKTQHGKKFAIGSGSTRSQRNIGSANRQQQGDSPLQLRA
jgi:RimJ/RimL family protein N-acetyltransferase